MGSEAGAEHASGAHSGLKYMGYEWLRALLFRVDPERVHRLTLRALVLASSSIVARALLRRAFSYDDPSLAVDVFGIRFPNPLGLAAGYDKEGRALRGLACLGFGHVELGTVTPLPQPGNPRPRIFRLPEDRALINRMGFPNRGAEALLQRIGDRESRDVVVGLNVGKGMNTPLEAAAQDYIYLLQTFYELVDYFVVNISSPNTVGLRRLQARDYLASLLRQISDARRDLSSASQKRVPVLVKLAPDLTLKELEDAVGVITAHEMDGVVATNTTIEREGLISKNALESGGLSGLPLRRRSTAMVRRIAQLSQGKLPIVGVGGVFDADDVREKMDAGAALVQVYTGLVYRGPGLARSILRELAEKE
ncbi:MAG: quinone-dependent dihydroorotate dehydrogenase [Anaerolineales bacterium]